MMQIQSQVGAKVKEDLDIVNIVDKQRFCLHQLELIKKVLQIDDDPAFAQRNMRGVYDFEFVAVSSKVEEMLKNHEEPKS
jgi:hypothetical protein